jgi:hypothetical protein
VEPIAERLRREEDRAVLRRIVRAVSEIGYEHFFDDAVSPEMAGGEDSPLGARGVLVMPGARHGREESRTEHREAGGVLGSGGSRIADAAQIVVAVSRRGRRGASLASVLTKLVERLAQPPAARTVMVLSDSWDAATFTAIARQRFAEQQARGVEFVFLLVGSPEHIVSPLPMILNGLAMQGGWRQPHGRREGSNFEESHAQARRSRPNRACLGSVRD